MTTLPRSEIRPNRKGWFKPYIAGTWQLYAMMLIPIIYIICFKYKPMLHVVIAFKKYNAFNPNLSVWDMPWVGFRWFEEAFRDSLFWKSLANTLILNLGDLILGFPFPILLAIFLNELTSNKVRKATQLALYLPNFLSWVIIAGISAQLFANYMVNVGGGLVNNIIVSLGGTNVPFLENPSWWRFVYWIMGIWQSAGYSLIIYLAALMSNDPSLSEAAYIDGATRMQRIWHVTVPQIMPTISTLLIMQVGKVVSISFDRPYMMSNANVTDASQVISTFVYDRAFTGHRFDYAAAIGLFQSVVGIILILIANQGSKKMGQEGII
ncbi:MAG: sugar ABC transporter permease [Clostridia bacterium]|nr:sugar ABC transporter permease [Clostridia bacterium]